MGSLLNNLGATGLAQDRASLPLLIRNALPPTSTKGKKQREDEKEDRGEMFALSTRLVGVPAEMGAGRLLNIKKLFSTSADLELHRRQTESI